MIRKAERQDVPLLLEFIRGIARYEKVVDYLTPRLFDPLRIDKPRWEESPQGINCGGWGLWLKTEDLAKMGQLLLQKGEWNGQQLIPAEWVAEISPSPPMSRTCRES